MAEEKINKFVINYLTEEQYAAALEAGTLNNNDFYCTSDITEEEKEEQSGAGATLIHSDEDSSVMFEKIEKSFEIMDGKSTLKNSIYFCARVSDKKIKPLPLVHSRLGTGDFGYYLELYFMALDGEMTNTSYGAFVMVDFASKNVTIQGMGEDELTRCEDTLTSTSTRSALAANQGRILNEKILALEARIAELEAGGIDLAVDPTDTSKTNIWIETN